jgi:hypothetical protein
LPRGIAVIDLSSETILTFNEARSRLPKRRRGKRPDISCLYRWATAGLRGHRLETLKIGGQTCTSLEALQRFFDALSGAPAKTSTRSRHKHDEAVERALAHAGI